MKALIDSAKQEIVTSLKAEITKINETLSALGHRVDLLDRRIDSISSRQNNNKTEINELRDKIENQATSCLCNDFEFLEYLSNEVEQRLTRRDNVIVFGIPETNDGSIQDRLQKDADAVRMICEALEIKDPVTKQFQRLGKRLDTRPRILRVKCDETTRRELLRKSKNLRNCNPSLNNIYINVDRTRLQQDQFRYYRDMKRQNQGKINDEQQNF